MPIDREELLRIRHDAHVIFDSFWKFKVKCDRDPMRQACYAWLREHTGMTERECHFGQFDIGVCLAVIELCRQAQAGLIAGPKMRRRKRPVIDTRLSGRQSVRLKRRIEHNRF